MANFMITGGFATWAIIVLVLACAIRLVQSTRKRNRLGEVRWKLGGITLSAGLVISILSVAMGIVEGPPGSRFQCLLPVYDFCRGMGLGPAPDHLGWGYLRHFRILGLGGLRFMLLERTGQRVADL